MKLVREHIGFTRGGDDKINVIFDNDYHYFKMDWFNDHQEYFERIR